MNESLEHREGPPWNIEKRFTTFEEADNFRSVLLESEEDLQVKIHWMGRTGAEFYAVKVRQDPSVAAELAAELRRAAKKRRKAKLNKKRRKK